MRGLMFYRVNKDNRTNIGVVKKAYAQAKAMRRLGIDLDLVLLSDKGILLNDQLIHTFHKPTLHKPSSTYWFYFFDFLPTLFKNILIKTYDLIYFRFALAHPGLIGFLKKMKQINPGIKIVMEIPTYPYEKEKRTVIDRLSLIMDGHFRKQLHRYVDLITHYGLAKEIWKIPTISIRNGIDPEQIPTSELLLDKNKIRLIAIANWSYWHGLDRLISGLEKYYQNKSSSYNITLTVVGFGKEIPRYKDLVKKADLQSYVSFLPPLASEQLDELFTKVDIGIGTLGIHRKGIEIDSSLKHREYCARGIPFILAGRDLDFPSSTPFVLKISEDEKTISMEEIIIFYEQMYHRSTEINKKVRKYAEEHLRWEQRLALILK